MAPLQRILMRGALAAVLLMPALAAAERKAHSSSPSYTPQQAQDGAQRYAEACALCHGAQLEGNFQTPPLSGIFVRHWAGAPLSELARYIHDAMPLMAPGTLSDNDVAALVAYLLAQNGTAAGHRPLPTTREGLSRLTFPAARLR